MHTHRVEILLRWQRSIECFCTYAIRIKSTCFVWEGVVNVRSSERRLKLREGVNLTYFVLPNRQCLAIGLTVNQTLTFFTHALFLLVIYPVNLLR